MTAGEDDPFLALMVTGGGVGPMGSPALVDSAQVVVGSVPGTGSAQTDEQVKEEGNVQFEERRSKLLRLAREDREAFIQRAGPEYDDGENVDDHSSKVAADVANYPQRQQSQDDATPGSSNVSEDGNSLGSDSSLPDGFAFPVTTKIMHFLNRFSSTKSQPFSKTEAVPSLEGQVSLDESLLVDREDQRPATNGSDGAEEKTLKAAFESTLSDPGARQSESGAVDSSDKPSHYAVLIAKLRDPSAVDLLGSIKNFVGRFLAEHARKSQDSSATFLSELDKESSWDGDTMPGQNNPAAQKVQEFLRVLERKMRAHPLWSGSNEADWDKTVEGLEKFVMRKIEKYAFQPTSKDRFLDNKLHRKIQSLSFLRQEHLELTRRGAPYLERWQHCGAELAKINRFRSPRDKIVCVLNCCRLIMSLLQDGDASGPQVGADEFVPALIYVVLKTNPSNLHSNLEYIAAYRNPTKLKAEPGYFFTQIAMAVSFIQGLDQGQTG
jgi:hypothetical protein